MAVTDVRIVSKSGEHVPGDYLYTTVYEVDCAATDSIPTILTASEGGVSIPTRGTAYPDDANAYCTHVGPAELLVEKDFTHWRVPVRYARYHLGDVDEDIRQPDPLDDDVQIDWGVRLVERVVAKDINGDPIDNSAGAAFDPPLMEDEAILTLRIVRNESTFDAEDAFNYANTTNSAGCTVAGLVVDARQAKCLGITGTRRVRNGTTYWQVTYEFEFKPATWAREVLDAGMFYLSGGEPVTFKDDEGAVMQSPQLLNGSGAEGTTAVYLTFNTVPEANFAALGLGSV